MLLSPNMHGLKSLHSWALLSADYGCIFIVAFVAIWFLQVWLLLV